MPQRLQVECTRKVQTMPRRVVSCLMPLLKICQESPGYIVGDGDARSTEWMGFCLPAKALQLATGLLSEQRLPLVLDLDDTLVLGKTKNDLLKEVKETAFKCVRHVLTSYLSLTSPVRGYPIGERHPFVCDRLHSQHAVHGLFIVNDLPTDTMRAGMTHCFGMFRPSQ